MEEVPIYDRAGKAEAYFANDGETIYSWHGRSSAYLVDDKIYGWNGKHLGWFEQGILFDRTGRQVGFLGKAFRGVTQVLGVKHVKQVKYVKHVRQVAFVRPVLSNEAANQALGEFIKFGQ